MIPLLQRFRTRNVTPSLRLDVLARDGWTCRYCGRCDNMRDLHARHIWPYSKGGPCVRWNLVTACSVCNRSIGTRFVLPLPRVIAWVWNWWRKWWWLVAGSGSALVAAYNKGRPSYGFEIDRKLYRDAKAWIDFNVAVATEQAELGYSYTLMREVSPQQPGLFAMDPAGLATGQ